MQLAYISGPMSGIVDFNYPAFSRAAFNLRAQGWSVISPHELHAKLDKAWVEYMRVDIRLLMECTCVFVLSGWQDSRGAKIEVAIAHALDMPIYVYEPDSDVFEQLESAFLPSIVKPVYGRHAA